MIVGRNFDIPLASRALLGGSTQWVRRKALVFRVSESLRGSGFSFPPLCTHALWPIRPRGLIKKLDPFSSWCVV